MSSPSLLGGRYRLETQIAAGAVGEVWRATDTVLARLVAVKVLRAGFADHAETLARFRGEARHAGALSHPAIARVYDYGEPVPPDPPFLVMELVDGPSLAEVLGAGPLGPGRTMDVVAQVAAGLQTAHEAGLVHRDIKPANLLFGPGGQVKITDFGIAHAAGSAPVTRTGAVIGTPAYLAPERVGGASATPAADLYSLGVVAYECLTGTPPFTGPPFEVAVAHRDRDLPALPPTVPVAVTHLVADLTAKDPAARPASAGEVAVRAGQLRDHPGQPWDHPGQAWDHPGQPWDHPGQAWDHPGQPWDHPAGNVPVAATSWRPAYPDTLVDVMAAGQMPELASQIGPHPWRRRRERLPWRRDRRLPGRGSGRPSWRMAAGVAVLAFLGVLGVAKALSGGAQPQQHGAAAPGTHSPSARPSLVTVSADSLIGQPVTIARQQLQSLGLTVQVRWHPSGQQAGTVLSVAPSGQVPPASTIVLSAAFAPRQHGDGHHHGDGGGQGG